MRFRDHRVVGDILELAARYRDEGADELVFYDITASPERRSVDRGWVRRVARVLDIPFCVAGGIRSVADAEAVLNAGAEKVSINSPALADPDLIDALSARFGSQCVVVGIDSQRTSDGYRVYQFTGDPRAQRASRAATCSTGCAKSRSAAPARSCSTAWRSDGVRRGYDIAQLRAVRGDLPRAARCLGRRGRRGALTAVLSSRPASTPRWPPASFTPAPSPSPTSSGRCGPPASRCDHEP